MQHPDEGLIHTWLDGQLPPEEAAALEAHIAHCPECAAKVANERGYVAGASRILTALDDVPRGVVPAAATRARYSRPFLQAAATLLVVATGGLLVARNRGSQPETVAAAKSPAAVDSPVREPDRIAITAPAVTAPAPLARSSVSPSIRDRSVATPVSVPSVNIASANKAVASANTPVASATTAPSVVSPAPAVVPVAPAPSSQVARNGATKADILVAREMPQLEAAVTTGVATVLPSKLKVVREEKIPRGRRTSYEIAPGKLALLTESNSVPTAETIQLSPQPATQRATASGGASGGSMAAVPPASADDFFNAISWRDEATGKSFTLSGPFTESELQLIRARIEAARSRAK